MRGFPIFLDVKPRHSKKGVVKWPLVFGSSELMTAKTRTLLLRAEKVEVACDVLHASLEPLINSGQVITRSMPNRWTLCPAILGRSLVLADPEHPKLAAKISRIAKAMGVPVNVPDVPDLCSFALAAIVDRDPVTIAIGTEGTSPVLSTKIRAQIESDLHPKLGVLAQLAQSFRGQVAQRLKPGIQRRHFWDLFFTPTQSVARAVFEDRNEDAHNHAQQLLEEESHDEGAKGKVILVGAGPGDPDLLTVKAVRAIKQADIILYDRLPGTEILSLARREVELLDVGKSKGKPSLKQHEIQELLVEHAREGKIVVRLKGGDPSIFARGGEELERLQSEGIATEVIPGITAASAVAASLQIPLTHRDLARTLTFVSGHAPDSGAADFGTLDMKALHSGQHTLVVYMGASRTKAFADHLMAGGWTPTTPVMIVESASQASERRIKTDLATLSGDHAPLNLKGPALILCGEVAGLPAAGAIENLEVAEHVSVKQIGHDDIAHAAEETIDYAP
jgi:uroporphyrin-III C-methyltransferase/precorrin-2 dehydrogenase/sirohydrochlorin ferrochelatase